MPFFLFFRWTSRIIFQIAPNYPSPLYVSTSYYTLPHKEFLGTLGEEIISWNNKLILSGHP
jgi:hypothetical protein